MSTQDIKNTIEPLWKAYTKATQVADAGDYNTWVELTNGEICLFTDESEEEELQELADKLNALSGISNPSEYIEGLKAEIERLKALLGDALSNHEQYGYLTNDVVWEIRNLTHEHR